MVKISDISKKDSQPNKSTVVINDDSVIIYLFSDGFSGLNKQVGYMYIENIFIEDKRENYALPKLKGIPNNNTMYHYRDFFKGMIDEYNRHYPKQGDSYIEIDNIILYNLLVDSVKKLSFDDPSHLFDIANFCMFLYHGLKRDLNYG